MVKWNAQEYNRSSAAQQSWARELIAKLSLTGNERLLDIGCGDGKVTAEIANILSDGSVVGVDKSEDMIGFARVAFPPDSCPNMSFAVMDALAVGSGSSKSGLKMEETGQCRAGRSTRERAGNKN